MASASAAASAPSSTTPSTRPPRHHSSIGGSADGADDLDMSVLSFGESVSGSGKAPRRRSSLGGGGSARLSEEEQAQAIKDYRLMVEYKWLKRQAPAGVFILPSHERLREWHGVVFVRRALYGTGIFKFHLTLPPTYNDANTHPAIHFVGPKPFHPMVHPETGELDIKGAYPTWDPDKHFVVTVLTFLKKIFYMKEPDFEPILVGRAPALNLEAAKLLRTDRREYDRRIGQCVAASQEAVYIDPLAAAAEAGTGTETEQPSISVASSLRFTEPAPEHAALLTALKDAYARIEAAERARGQQPGQQQQHPTEPVPRRLPTLEVVRSLQHQQQQQQPPVVKMQPQQQQQQQQPPPPRSPGLLAGLWGRK